MPVQPVEENEPLAMPMDTSGEPDVQAVVLPQAAAPSPPRNPDALEVYLQVQRSVICMQKYVRGFMVRPFLSC
jgi:hypothetical protein